MSADPVTPLAEELSLLLDQRLKVRGSSLEAQLKQTRRLLPKRVRVEAGHVADAQMLMQNPKLARMVDVAGVEKSYGIAKAHLETIDRREILKDRVLKTAAKISAVLIALFIFAIWYAVQQGWV